MRYLVLLLSLPVIGCEQSTPTAVQPTSLRSRPDKPSAAPIKPDTANSSIAGSPPGPDKPSAAPIEPDPWEKVDDPVLRTIRREVFGPTQNDVYRSQMDRQLKNGTITAKERSELIEEIDKKDKERKRREYLKNFDRMH